MWLSWKYSLGSLNDFLMASAKSVPVVTVQIIEKMKNREKIYKLLEVSYCVMRGHQSPGL